MIICILIVYFSSLRFRKVYFAVLNRTGDLLYNGSRVLESCSFFSLVLNCGRFCRRVKWASHGMLRCLLKSWVCEVFGLLWVDAVCSSIYLHGGLPSRLNLMLVLANLGPGIQLFDRVLYKFAPSGLIQIEVEGNRMIIDGSGKDIGLRLLTHVFYEKYETWLFKKKGI